MNCWKLTKTLETDPLQLINNSDFVMRFRIEIFENTDKTTYRASLYRLWHYKLRLAHPYDNDTSTEEIWSTEESLDIESLRYPEADSLIARVIEELSVLFKPID